MTIRTFKAVLAGSAMLALGLSANVAQAATAVGNAKAQILKAITVSKTFDVDFGTIVTSAAGGVATLTNAGTVTCTGVVCAGAPAAGVFAVTGTTGQVVTLSTTNAVLAGPTGSATMLATLGTSSTTLTLSGTAATDVFKVSGTLAVGTNQAEGVYTGPFTVTVNYQ